MTLLCVSVWVGVGVGVEEMCQRGEASLGSAATLGLPVSAHKGTGRVCGFVLLPSHTGQVKPPSTNSTHI